MGITEISGIIIDLIAHSAVNIRAAGAVIYIDPFRLPEESSLPKADIILISHSHYDHCSIEDIEKISTPQTSIITVPDCQSKISRVHANEVVLVAPGKTVQIGKVKIGTTAAYNNGKEFHPKENGWVGFIVEIAGTKIYHSGDTDLIPEMKEIDVDVAFLPVGGTYTMTGPEAAKATKVFKRCSLAIPMHYGAIIGTRKDAEEFQKLAGCDVKILI